MAKKKRSTKKTTALSRSSSGSVGDCPEQFARRLTELRVRAAVAMGGTPAERMAVIADLRQFIKDTPDPACAELDIEAARLIALLAGIR
jgi:hypothetical protein